MISNFPRLVKKYFGHLPQDDYPVLNTFLFVSSWLEFVMNQGKTSMQSLFKHLNIRGIDVDITTFSKAQLFLNLRQQLRKQHQLDQNKLALFPLDSTIVTLTSKLLWQQGYHQVKLFSGAECTAAFQLELNSSWVGSLNLLTSEPGGVFLHFGQGHDSKYGNPTIGETPENGVSIMDRGFSSLGRIQELLQETNSFFLLRIRNNIKLEILENGNCLIGTGSEQVEARVVHFCDWETGSEFRLVTNLLATGASGLTNEEIGEFYRLRWQIELFWKFLKMHLNWID